MRAENPGPQKTKRLQDAIAVAQGYENHADAVQKIARQERLNIIREQLAPIKMDGKQVIDEACDCGHKLTEHNDHFSFGHGSCTICGCACRQFTWAGWIIEGGEGD